MKLPAGPQSAHLAATNIAFVFILTLECDTNESSDVVLSRPGVFVEALWCQCAVVLCWD